MENIIVKYGINSSDLNLLAYIYGYQDFVDVVQNGVYVSIPNPQSQIDYAKEWICKDLLQYAIDIKINNEKRITPQFSFSNENTTFEKL